MSDYLGHLVARTVSPDAVVRPQLPSLFEPPLVGQQTKSELSFEQETFSEQPSTPPHSQRHSQASPEQPAPLHSELHKPEALAPQISRAKRSVQANEASDPVREESVPDSIVNRPKKKPVSNRAEISLEPVPPKLRKNDLREQRLEIDPHKTRGEEEKTFIPQIQSPSFQPKSGSLLTSASTVKRDRPVQPVVPSVRALRPVQPARMPAPEPTINVTIGRVEIRAASPPPPQRARAKSANVLSLEDYLRQRANGGGR